MLPDPTSPHSDLQNIKELYRCHQTCCSSSNGARSCSKHHPWGRHSNRICKTQQKSARCQQVFLLHNLFWIPETKDNETMHLWTFPEIETRAVLSARRNFSAICNAYLHKRTYARTYPHQNTCIIPARDPKQCALRILYRKAERTYKHQWLQATRTRATLVVKTNENKRSQVRFCDFPLWRSLCARSLKEFSGQDFCKRPLGKISIGDVLARSPQQISICHVLWARSR